MTIKPCRSSSKSVALIDTVPAGVAGAGVVNLGLEIVRDHYGGAARCDLFCWRDKIEVGRYDLLAFNVYYPLHLLNVAPFLRRNGLPLRAGGGGPYRIAGGQGVSNLLGIANPLFDQVFLGEIDGDQEDRHGFWRASEILSPPVMRFKKANIEVARGCKYGCRFCEYSHIGGGRYREKKINLLKHQIDVVVERGIKQINLMTVNLSGYSALDELLFHCKALGVRPVSADICYQDFDRIEKWMDYVGTGQVRIGVESWDEATRKRIGKPISDEALEDVIRRVSRTAGMIHFYLIYGLPEENYESWLRWIPRLASIRREFSEEVETLFGMEVRPTKALRYDIAMTNFEPCFRTPFAGKSPVFDFKAKAEFLRRWTAGLRESGFIKKDGPVFGRFGKGELSYRVLLAVKEGGEEMFDPLVDCFRNGIGKSISRSECERFLDAQAGTKGGEAG